MASGDHQNTNQKPTGKKATELSQDEQSERFVKAARSLDSDESGELFKNLVDKITQPKRP